jgi:hypothetical protein
MGKSKTNANAIMIFCKEADKPVTARQILDACFPGKTQPYINETINRLVQAKELIRDDSGRSYTVRLPREGEEIPEPRDYSRASIGTQSSVLNAFTMQTMKITEDELEKTARLVKSDPRYGEEAATIASCFNKFPKNVDSDIIAMKIALIDMTNSTNLSKHLSKVYLSRIVSKIMNSNFDERIKVGDASLVSELARNEVNLFSFFSKYCLYHNYYVHKRDDYAIFDVVIKQHIGKFIAYYEYNGKTYRQPQLHRCVDEMRQTYDYEGFLLLIDTILDANDINCCDKRRKLDWYVWYTYR